MKNEYDEYESQLDSSLQFHYNDPEPHFDKNRVKGLIASLIEVAAMNHRLKVMGYNAAEAFTNQLNQYIQTKSNS